MKSEKVQHYMSTVCLVLRCSWIIIIIILLHWAMKNAKKEKPSDVPHPHCDGGVDAELLKCPRNV